MWGGMACPSPSILTICVDRLYYVCPLSAGGEDPGQALLLVKLQEAPSHSGGGSSGTPMKDFYI